MAEWYRMKNGDNHKFYSSELSVETSCDSSDPFNIFSEKLSPIPASIVPRKLDFTTMDDDGGPRDGSPAPDPDSPLYKGVDALRLSSPRTPSRNKCSTPSHPLRAARLFPARLHVPAGTPSGSSYHLHPASDGEDSALGSLLHDERDMSRLQRPQTNINPFTPDGQALNKKKRAHSKTPTSWDATPPEQPAKRLRESNISRYNEEFEEMDVIGRGEFGRVARCLNKLDRYVYAVKRSLRPVAWSAAEHAALYEVYAHAVLAKHTHVVRYYSAWLEDNHLIIQNEYCDGGSLQQKVAASGALPETELLVLLAHIAKGLSYIHSHSLVHMDVKPGNIFICSGATDESDSDEDTDLQPQHTYKIGDLGHVTCVTNPNVAEGDCRYLPKEVLHEDFSQLMKADIFAFGLTLWEAAGGESPLPKNGPAWHAYRDGKLPHLPQLSREFNQLLQKMVDPDPSARPTAASLRRHSLLQPLGNKSRAALRRELHAARCKNELLQRKFHEATRCIQSLESSASGRRTRSTARTPAAAPTPAPARAPARTVATAPDPAPGPGSAPPISRRMRKL